MYLLIVYFGETLTKDTLYSFSTLFFFSFIFRHVVLNLGIQLQYVRLFFSPYYYCGLFNYLFIRHSQQEIGNYFCQILELGIYFQQ